MDPEATRGGTSGGKLLKISKLWRSRKMLIFIYVLFLNRFFDFRVKSKLNFFINRKTEREIRQNQSCTQPVTRLQIWISEKYSRTCAEIACTKQERYLDFY